MPGTQEELQTDQNPLVIFWFQTRLGVHYELPDMLPQHVDEAHRQLDLDLELVTLRNISGVAMVVPKRIVKTAGANDRCFWEAND